MHKFDMNHNFLRSILGRNGFLGQCLIFPSAPRDSLTCQLTDLQTFYGVNVVPLRTENKICEGSNK